MNWNGSSSDDLADPCDGPWGNPDCIPGGNHYRRRLSSIPAARLQLFCSSPVARLQHLSSTLAIAVLLQPTSSVHQ